MHKGEWPINAWATKKSFLGVLAQGDCKLSFGSGLWLDWGSFVQRKRPRTTMSFQGGTPP